MTSKESHGMCKWFTTGEAWLACLIMAAGLSHSLLAADPPQTKGADPAPAQTGQVVQPHGGDFSGS